MAKLAMQTGNGHELALTEFYSLFVFCFEEPVLYVIYELERSVQVKKMCHQNCFEHQRGLNWVATGKKSITSLWAMRVQMRLGPVQVSPTAALSGRP